MQDAVFASYLVDGSLYAFKGELRCAWAHGVFRIENHATPPNLPEDWSLGGERWSVTVRLGNVSQSDQYLFERSWRYNDASAEAIDCRLAACVYYTWTTKTSGTHHILYIASLVARWPVLKRTKVELKEWLKCAPFCQREVAPPHYHAEDAIVLQVYNWVYGTPHPAYGGQEFEQWMVDAIVTSDKLKAEVLEEEMASRMNVYELMKGMQDAAVLANQLSTTRYGKFMVDILRLIPYCAGTMDAKDEKGASADLARKLVAVQIVACYTLWGTRQPDGEVTSMYNLYPDRRESLMDLHKFLSSRLEKGGVGQQNAFAVGVASQIVNTLSILANELGIQDPTANLKFATELSEELEEGEHWPITHRTLDDIMRTIWLSSFMTQR